MGLQSFDRNFGMTQTRREFWGGDNGFVTVMIKLPADVEIGETKVEQDVTDEAQTALTVAHRNLNRIVQALALRGVIVTTSVLEQKADASKVKKEVGGNVLAFASVGELAAGMFAVTFIVERANVFDKQDKKPGAIVDLQVDPTKDLAESFSARGFFVKKDGEPAEAAEVVGVKVFNALPAIVL